jgi:hypothetical protein
MSDYAQRALQQLDSMKEVFAMMQDPPEPVKQAILEQMDMYRGLVLLEPDAMRWRFIEGLMRVSMGDDDETQNIAIQGDFSKIFDKVSVNFVRDPSFKELVDLMMEIEIVTTSEEVMERMMKK